MYLLYVCFFNDYLSKCVTPSILHPSMPVYLQICLYFPSQNICSRQMLVILNIKNIFFDRRETNHGSYLHVGLSVSSMWLVGIISFRKPERILRGGTCLPSLTVIKFAEAQLPGREQRRSYVKGRN